MALRIVVDSSRALLVDAHTAPASSVCPSVAAVNVHTFYLQTAVTFTVQLKLCCHEKICGHDSISSGDCILHYTRYWRRTAGVGRIKSC